MIKWHKTEEELPKGSNPNVIMFFGDDVDKMGDEHIPQRFCIGYYSVLSDMFSYVPCSELGLTEVAPKLVRGPRPGHWAYLTPEKEEVERSEFRDGDLWYDCHYSCNCPGGGYYFTRYSLPPDAPCPKCGVFHYPDKVTKARD